MSNRVPDRKLRGMSGKWVLAVRMGSIHGLAEDFESARHLVRHAKDPTIRSAFLISRVHLLTLLARYGESIDAVLELENEAKHFRLEFAWPHISMARAHAHLGMRQFAQAAPLIAYAEEYGFRRSDVFVQMNAAVLRARLLLYEGLANDAVAHLREHWQALPERSLYAEYLSLRALALACLGEVDACEDEIECILQMTRGIEARVLALSARAIGAAALGGADASEKVSAALEASLDTGDYDGLFLACRLSPPLTAALSEQPRCQTHLAPIVRAAGDHMLARQLGVPLPPRISADRLTPRESEVYELLALGRTNKEIAGALFISEPTAKLHTLHVLEKLALRSRTEVALHAAEARRPYLMEASDEER
jgi:DNA-binding NarL/FixJ family response regulator